MRIAIIIVLVCVVGAALPAQASKQVSSADVVTIRGKAVFKGDPKEFQQKPFDKVDGTLCQPYQPILDESVMVNGTKPPTLSNVVIWIKSGPLDFRTPSLPEQELLVAKGCRFEPRVTILQERQGLLVRNEDPFPQAFHIENTKERPRRVTIPKPGMQMIMNFQEEPPFKVHSPEFPWMTAWIVVLPHPFALLTRGDGGFEFVDFAPGTYEIGAWHEVFGEQTISFEAKVGEPNELTISFEPKKKD